MKILFTIALEGARGLSLYDAKMSETGQISSSTCASCSGQIGWPTSEEPKETVPLIQKLGL